MKRSFIVYKMIHLIHKLLFLIICIILSFCFYVVPMCITVYWLFDLSFTPLFLVLFSILIATAVVYYFKSHNTFILLKLLVYEGMGLGFFSVTSLFILQLSHYIIPTDNILKGLLLISAIVIFRIFTYYKASSIHLKELYITSSKIKSPCKIVFISDVHLGSNSKHHLEKIVTKINELTIDILCIGGDLIDSSSITLDSLTCLNRLNIPIYFVTGNHEYYLKNTTDILKNISSHSIFHLQNTSHQHNEIHIIGISDNQSTTDQKDTIHSLMKKNVMNIVLVHKPSVWSKLQIKPDLMLCGHTHNGQIWPFNYLVKLQFPTIYGLYKDKKSTLYVSSGAGTWGPKMRLGSANEIVLIHLT